MIWRYEVHILQCSLCPDSRFEDHVLYERNLRFATDEGSIEPMDSLDRPNVCGQWPRWKTHPKTESVAVRSSKFEQWEEAFEEIFRGRACKPVSGTTFRPTEWTGAWPFIMASNFSIQFSCIDNHALWIGKYYLLVMVEASQAALADSRELVLETLCFGETFELQKTTGLPFESLDSRFSLALNPSKSWSACTLSL